MASGSRVSELDRVVSFVRAFVILLGLKAMRAWL